MPRKKKPITAPPHGHSRADVLALTSATQSNLIHWANLEIITPEIEDTAGTGFPRRFSARNVIEVELAAAINRFRVPVTTIRGALNVFSHFHVAMRAVHELTTKAPLVVDPPHLKFFETPEHRSRVAQAFVMNHVHRHFDGPMRTITQADVDRAGAHVETMGRVWAELRTGALVKGTPDTSWSHFFALFVSGFYEGNDAAFAMVELNPPNLRTVIEESAIVIDLATVVFRVGERCKRLSVTLGEW